MARLDLWWGGSVELRERHWNWRHETEAQIVNPDIDGLLTACLLRHLKGWPVIGFYDTKRLMLDTALPVPLDLRKTIWVDVDMCWPGARSLSQHVVLDAPSDADDVAAYHETVNPSLLNRHSRCSRYTSKYPFGTFQWAWWLAGRRTLPELPDPHDPIMTGLAWMPDGGFQSVEGRWRDNCVRWATQLMPGSILAPLALTDPTRARAAVREAAKEVRRRSGVDRGWRNQQFTLTHGSPTGPVLNIPLDEAPQALQALCDAIAGIYGWTAPALPTSYSVHEGAWRSGPAPPRGWPQAANRREVVSLAVTRADQFCWTEPGDLGIVLGSHAAVSSKGSSRAD